MQVTQEVSRDVGARSATVHLLDLKHRLVAGSLTTGALLLALFAGLGLLVFFFLNTGYWQLDQRCATVCTLVGPEIKIKITWGDRRCAAVCTLVGPEAWVGGRQFDHDCMLSKMAHRTTHFSTILDGNLLMAESMHCRAHLLPHIVLEQQG